MSKNTSNEVFPGNVVDPLLLADINGEYLEEETSMSKRGPKVLTVSVIEPVEEEIDDDITLRNFVFKKRKLTSAGGVGGEGVDALKGCYNDYSDDSCNISVEGMDSFEDLAADEDVSGDNVNNRIVPFVPTRSLRH
ncbi:hypothetical protein M5689_012751 [Euphorbia peplus]|nr:hypothetical protein M5689_012751 [Euphorbia peplus]